VLPAQAIVYIAIAGKGVFKNGQLLEHLNNISIERSQKIAVRRPRKISDSGIEELYGAIERCLTDQGYVLIPGNTFVALDILAIAEDRGPVKLVYHGKSHDVLPAAAIAAQAGQKVSEVREGEEGELIAEDIFPLDNRRMAKLRKGERTMFLIESKSQDTQSTSSPIIIPEITPSKCPFAELFKNEFSSRQFYFVAHKQHSHARTSAKKQNPCRGYSPPQLTELGAETSSFKN